VRKKLDQPEFVDPESVLTWRRVEGNNEGAWEMILYLDEESGTYARLLKLDPGHQGLPSPMTHEFDEVVFNLTGEIVDDITGTVYGPGTYAHFPAGQQHGPYSSPKESLAIEFRHYRHSTPKSSSS